MRLRLLEGADSASHKSLMVEAFFRGERPADPQAPTDGWSRDLTLSRTIGAVQNSGRVVAAVTVHPLRLSWGERGLACGGVADVACSADHRGTGLAGRLLTYALEEMRERGQILSGLFPFAYAFYRRHGWEWVGENRRTTVPLRLLPASRQARCVRLYDGLAGKERAQEVYGAFAARYRGMVLRDECEHPDFWARALDHNGGRTNYVQVYESPETGRAEGFLNMVFPASGDRAWITNFMATTPRAYDGLIGLLHGYAAGGGIESIEYPAPIDDPMPLHAMHHELNVRLTPLFMGRVVDAVAAIQAIDAPASASGSLILGIRDETCQWNDGAFQIEIDGGKARAERSSADADVSMDIQALAQAFWGSPSLDRLRWAGRVDVRDEDAYALLSKLLPSTTCFLADHF